MVVRRIGVLSLAKIMGIIYAAIGLIAGFFMAMAGALMAIIPRSQDFGPFAFLFGIGGIIFMPIIYGIAGFVGGVIVSGIYNVAAGFVGGLEIEFETPPPGSGGYGAKP